MSITLFYGAVLALMYVGLALEVVYHRRRAKVGIGHGDDRKLRRSIRVHANFGEYVPFAVVLVGLLEADAAPAWALHTMGTVLVVSRVLHRVGLGAKAGTSLGRFWGTAGVLGVLGVGAIWGLVRSLG